jgi:hypothetical protein
MGLYAGIDDEFADCLVALADGARWLRRGIVDAGFAAKHAASAAAGVS